MSDVTQIFELRLVAIGYCEDPEGEHAVAWDTETGFEWRRVLEAETGGFLFNDVSTDGGSGGALIVATRQDRPLLWTGDVWDGFDSIELPTTTDWASVTAVSWDGYRYLAVGEEAAGGNQSKAVAWLNRGDGAGWQLIDVPPDATSFHEVAGEETMGGSSFVVLGTAGTDVKTSSWRLDDEGNWSELSIVLDASLEDANLDVLIDPQTAVGGDGLWVLDDETWTGSVIETQFFAHAGVRLQDGMLIAGGPNIHDSLPLHVFASANGADWRRVDDLGGNPRARIDGLTTFTHGVVGVGDAVYAGPGTIMGYQ